MGKTLGLVGLLIVGALGFVIYTRQATSVTPGAVAGGNPQGTAMIAGVRNDLLAIAQAERGEFALNGKYASLDALRDSGALKLPANGRGPYQYSAEVSDSSFRVVATYSGEPAAGMPHTFSVDDSMQVKQE